MEFKSTKMVYFSPTKTTKKVLESIAYGLGIAKVVDYDLTCPQNSKKDITTFKDELVIIGLPVHAGRLPVVAVERFKRLKASNTLAIIVVVYGNREFEDALLELKNLTTELGFIPIAAGAFIAEHSYSTSETPIAEGRPDILDIQKTMDFALKIKDKIKTISTSKIDLEVPGNFPYKDAMPLNTVAPVVNKNLCDLCGSCIDICPTEAIFSKGSIETNAHLCIRCCACVKSCPNEARVIEDTNWKAIGARLNANCSTRKEPQVFL